MDIFRKAAGVWLALAACAPALACSCVGPISYCENLPDRADSSTAVFVGRVQSVRESGMARHVRFQVLEDFAGAPGSVFELTTHVQASACGIDFVAGKTYLVEADRQAAGEGWRTSICSRTKVLEHAGDDLRVLRIWKSGRTLPARITGEVWDPLRRRNLPRVKIVLLGGKRTLATVTDEKGQFAFENLEPASYQVEALLPAGTRRLPADLTRAWCARLIFSAE